MLTVKELKAMLDQCDDTDVVILSKDAEGNGYSPLYDLEMSMYIPDSGDVYIRELTEGYTEDDLTDDATAVKCIVLCPV